ncbi:hypothetical protein [Brucella sp. 22210]|uniref:hypothetical protein n=1 Tax=Brucella sp. 22210 TaxID=3453892 RepID=UPI003F859899
MQEAAKGKAEDSAPSIILAAGIFLSIPVFALAIYGKNEKGNLSKAEQNELARILPKLADAYRQRKDKK